MVKKKDQHNRIKVFVLIRLTLMDYLGFGTEALSNEFLLLLITL